MRSPFVGMVHRQVHDGNTEFDHLIEQRVTDASRPGFQRSLVRKELCEVVSHLKKLRAGLVC